MGNSSENSKRWASGGQPPEGHLSPERLSAWLEGDCTPAEQTSIASHLASCELCRLEKAQLELFLTDLRALPELDAPPAFVSRVMERVEVEAPAGVWRTVLYWLGLTGSTPFRRLVPIAAPLAVTVLAVVMVRRPESDEVSMPALERPEEAAGLELPPGAEANGIPVPAAPASAPKGLVGELGARLDQPATLDKRENFTPKAEEKSSDITSRKDMLSSDADSAILDAADEARQVPSARERRGAGDTRTAPAELPDLDGSVLPAGQKQDAQREPADALSQKSLELERGATGGAGEGLGGLGTLGGLGKGADQGIVGSGYGAGGGQGRALPGVGGRGADKSGSAAAGTGSSLSEGGSAVAAKATAELANKPRDQKELAAQPAPPSAVVQRTEGHTVPAAPPVTTSPARAKAGGAAAQAPAAAAVAPAQTTSTVAAGPVAAQRSASSALEDDSAKLKVEKKQSFAELMVEEARSRDAETQAAVRQPEPAKEVQDLFRFARPDAIIVLELRAGALSGLTTAVREVGGQVGPQLVRENGRGRIPIILPRGAYPRLIETLRTRGSLGATPPPDRPNAERIWVELEPPL